MFLTLVSDSDPSALWLRSTLHSAVTLLERCPISQLANTSQTGTSLSSLEEATLSSPANSCKEKLNLFLLFCPKETAMPVVSYLRTQNGQPGSKWCYRSSAVTDMWGRFSFPSAGVLRRILLNSECLCGRQAISCSSSLSKSKFFNEADSKLVACPIFCSWIP